MYQKRTDWPSSNGTAWAAEVSDQQWRDVLGVRKVQGERLDRAYLQRMAGELGVGDLLQRAIEASGR